MLSFRRKKDLLYPIVVWLLLLTWYWIIGHAILSSTNHRLDRIITSHAFWFFNRAPDLTDRITIVGVDEASRRKLGQKWPWRRDVTARLIENLAAQSPRVIGLDIVFSGRSEPEEDNRLVTAIRSQPGIVLGYVHRGASRDLPAKKFVDAASSVGFVNKALDGGVVANVLPCYKNEGGRIDRSIELALLENSLGLKEENLRITKEGLLWGNGFFIPCRQGRLALNYLVHEARFRVIPAHKVLANAIDPRDITDKIVLVGATDPILHDEFPTPLGVFKGVSIVGNALVMLMSQRFLNYVSPLFAGVLALCFGGLIVVVNRCFGPMRSAFISLMLMLLACAGFLFFRANDLVLPYSAILFSGSAAYLTCNLYKYLSLFWISNYIRNKAIIDPGTGLFTRRYFLLKFHQKIRVRRRLAFIGLRFHDYHKLTMDLNYEELNRLLRILGDYVTQELRIRFRQTTVARISGSALGAGIEGEDEERVARFAEGLQRDGARREWKTGDKELKNGLDICLIFKPAGHTMEQCSLLTQMKRLFSSSAGKGYARGVLEETPPGQSQDGIHGHGDELDFVAFDWDERNKDLEKSLNDLLETNKRLERLSWGTLTALARAIDAKSPWTAGHSERVTQLALEIARDMGMGEIEQERVHRAGLLHDIGKLVLATALGDDFKRIIFLAREQDTPFCEAEQNIIGITHAEVGAYLLSIWGLSNAIVEAVAFHHRPHGSPGEEFNAMAAVHFADALEHEMVADISSNIPNNRLNQPYLDRMGLNERLPVWREVCCRTEHKE